MTLRRDAEQAVADLSKLNKALEDKEDEIATMAGKLGAREVALMEQVRDLEEKLGDSSSEESEPVSRRSKK